MRARKQKPKGSVVFNKSRCTWNLLYMENGHRRSKLLGTAAELPTKEEAVRKAEVTRRDLRLIQERTVPTVKEIVDRFRVEKMSQRFSTQYFYETWLKNHILPKWGDRSITELQPREVEMWLISLSLSPKSMVHIRGIIRQLWEFSMWTGEVPIQRNPMELVRVKNAKKRTRMKPKSLTVEEFQRFLSQLDGSVRVIALVCVSFGLRISECLGLKWGDVDWLNSRLGIERGVVRNIVDKVKTAESEKKLSIDESMKAILQVWRQKTEFPSPEDWMFASPVRIGKEPVSYSWIDKEFRAAAKRAGIPVFGTHSLRHTYRSWLDAAGTPIAVQQKLMRHSDIRTTMNIYGDVVTDEMEVAHSKVVQMALGKTN